MIFSVENFEGKVEEGKLEQEEIDKDMRQRKHKVVNMRILIVPLFTDTQCEIYTDLGVTLKVSICLIFKILSH